MNLRTRKVLAVIQILLQLCPPSLLFWLAPSAHASNQNISQPAQPAAGTSSAQSQQDETENNVAQAAIQAGTMLGSGNAGNALVSQATGAASSEVQKWLNQFGTARVSISTDEHFTLNDSDLDLLIPLYDQKENLLFTQLGGRRHDDRNIINTGLGYRHFSDKWMWGTNIFYDRQISDNHHERLGVGTELGWDYLKLSANGYFRLSDWMSSSRYADYDERAANGFDIRATGYLPAYPQLGATMVYEQYFGNSVGLFGDDESDRQKNPHAITLGLNYTPVPFITLGANQKMGKGGENDTQINLALNWTPGVPLSDQFDPSSVAARRSLLGSRQDLVDRNNNIVLEYRKQDLISLSLPEQVEGEELSTQSVTAKVKAKYGLDHIEWQAASFLNNGGKITAGSSPEQFVLTLPSWQSSDVNSYTLTATAWDKNGNASNASSMKVNVTGIDVNTLQSTTTVSPTKISADGASTATVTVTLRTANAESATGLASRMSTTLISSATGSSNAVVDGTVKKPSITSFSETSAGVYTATITSGTTSDTLTIQPYIDGKVKLASAKLIEEAMVTVPHLTSLDTSATSAIAGGSTPITLTAHVTDQYGAILKDAVIDWTADNTKAQLSTVKSTTDDKGTAQIQVSSTEVINTVVTAQLEGGNSLSTPTLSFTADAATAKVTSISNEKDTIVANNTDTSTVTAMVADDNGNALSDVTVNWTVTKSDGTKVSQKTTATNNQGAATLTLKSTKTGVVTVTADVNGNSPKSTGEITFVADSSSQNVTSITLSKSTALANGSDGISYEATVTDAFGNAIANATVLWASDNADMTLSQPQTTSDANGKTSIQVTSLKAGDVVISAQTSTGTAYQASKATFSADSSSAFVSSLDSDRDSALANGTDSIEPKATVTDTHGNPVAGVDVSWSVSPSTGTLSATTSKTDSNGVATVTLTSTSVENYKVTATTTNGPAKELSPLSFTVDSATTHLDSVSASSTSALADSTTAITLTATVIDQSGHPVPNEAINWSADNAKAILSATQSTTDAQGQAQITVKSADVITTIVTAQRGSAESVKSDPLNFTADIASASVHDVRVDKTQVVANNSDSSTATAIVMDSNNHPLSGITVNWKASKTDGSSAATATSTTNDQGEATWTLKSAKTGTITVWADVNGNDAKGSSAITFIADTSTQQIETVTPDKSSALANGSDKVTYTAVVQDAQGNPLDGITVNWSTNNANATLSATSTTSNASGESQITVTSLKPGQVVISAQTSESVAKQASAVTFTADSSSATISSLSATNNPALANGTDGIVVSATVLDANKNPVSNIDVNWSATPGGGMLSATSSKTNDSGVATVTLTSTEIATYDVTAAVANGSPKSISGLTFTADTATAELKTVTSSATSALANNVATITLTATVRDQSGNPVKDQPISWSADNGSAELSATQSTTDAQGEAQITVKSADVITTIVTAQRGSAESKKSEPLSFTADESSASVVAIGADKYEVVANNIDSSTSTAKVEDSSGHPLSGITVNWNVKKTDGTSAGSKTSITDSEGNAILTLKSAKTGTATASASVSGTAAKEDKVTTFIADASTQNVTQVEPSKTTAVANGSDSITYVATVLDGQNNPVSGALVNWSTDNADMQLSATSTTSDTNGKSQITVTSLKSGDVVISAQTDAGVAYKAVKTTFSADINQAKMTLVSDKDKTVADGTSEIVLSATLVDANNNPITDTEVNWSVAPTTGTLSAAKTTTDSSGVAKVTLTSAEIAEYQVDATMSGGNKASASKTGLIFTADSTTANVSSLTADKDVDIVAGKDTVTLTALVLDGSNHPVPGMTVNWSSTETNSTFSANSSVTDSDGKATVTFSSLKAGSIDVTGTLSLSTSKASKTLLVIGDVSTATFSSVVPDVTEAVADGTAAITWTATVWDANKNLLKDVAVNWTSDNTNVVLSATNGTTLEDGTVTVSGTSIKSGSVKATATITSPSATKTSSVANFIGDVKTAKIDSLKPNVDHVAAGTSPVTYTATVSDINNNPVSGGSVAWTTDLNTLSAQTSTTNASGIATVKLSGSEFGVATVTATINESTKTDSTVNFLSTIEFDWNITDGATADTQINGPTETQFPDLGFITTGDTTGPTSLVWSQGGYSVITAPFTDDKGNTRTVTLRGMKANKCGASAFNAALGCEVSSNYPHFTYRVTDGDNANLPAGTWHGAVTFDGKDWHTSWALSYVMNVTITVH